MNTVLKLSRVFARVVCVAALVLVVGCLVSWIFRGLFWIMLYLLTL